MIMVRSKYSRYCKLSDVCCCCGLHGCGGQGADAELAGGDDMCCIGNHIHNTKPDSVRPPGTQDVKQAKCN